MEFEDLSMKVDWQARRVAAAFGVEDWISGRFSANSTAYETEGGSLEWVIREDGELSSITMHQGAIELLPDADKEDSWMLQVWDPLDEELMVRALYKLGFDEPTIFDQLPPLTAHEKLELRLSMPREFWPEKWLDEEG